MQAGSSVVSVNQLRVVVYYYWFHQLIQYKNGLLALLELTTLAGVCGSAADENNDGSLFNKIATCL